MSRYKRGVTFFQMLRDVLVASLNRGQFPLAIMGLVCVVAICRMPPADLSRLMFRLMDTAEAHEYGGYVLSVVITLSWAIHSKRQRREMTTEIWAPERAAKPTSTDDPARADQIEQEGEMIILLEIMFFMALAHFIYESILAPSWRMSLRFRLFAIRDEVRALMVERPDLLDDRHCVYLQDSINTMISMLHRYDVAAIAAAEFRYRSDPGFRMRVEARATILDDCSIPQVQSVRQRSVDLIARAIAVNSGVVCAVLYPFALMGIGFSTLHKRLGKFSALSKWELESVAPDRLGVAIL